MSVEEFFAYSLFSSSGSETRIDYVSGGNGDGKIEFLGIAAINTPTDAKRWHIAKFIYNADDCVTRIRRRADQQKYDDRASLFP